MSHPASGRLAVRLSICSLLFTACVATEPGTPVQPATTARAPDGLLQRSRLQAVVDAGVRRDADALNGYLSDAEPEVRARGVHARISPRGGRRIHARWRNRVQAIQGLGAATERPDVQAALFRALDDPSLHVATTAASALATAGPADRHEVVAWKRWIRENSERWQVGSVLLPSLVESGETAFVLDRLRTWRQGGFPEWGAYHAVASIPGDAATDILLSGLASPDRRHAYAATAALARRLSLLPRGTMARERIFEAISARLDAWGPQAPGSDLRGILAEHGDIALELDTEAAPPTESRWATRSSASEWNEHGSS